MSISLEALQSKAKLNNLRAQKFAKDNLWPEMMPREEPLFGNTAHQLKQGILAVMDKLKLTGKSKASRQREQDELETAELAFSEEANEEGFIEINNIKTE